MSAPRSEVPADYAAMFKVATEAAEAHARAESHADDMAAVLARFAPPPPKASPWVDWLRSSLLPLAIFAVGAFVAYGHDQAATNKSLADLSRNLDVISQRLDRDERETTDRVRDLVPVIRQSQMSQSQSELIDRQQNERIQSIAESIIQMRGTVETLRDAVNKTHEDMMIDWASRGQKEGRLFPGRSSATAVVPGEDEGK